MTTRRMQQASRWQLCGWLIGALVATNLIAVALVLHRDAPSTPGPAVAALRATAQGRTAVPAPAKKVGSADNSSLRFAADRPNARAGAAPCLSVRVLASLENADMVRGLAASYMSVPRDVDGRCVRIQVAASASGDAEAAAATGFTHMPLGSRPTIWLPDSVAWLRLARRTAGGVLIPSAEASVAESAVVVAMPAPLAAAIGWRTHSPTWSTVLRAAADAGVWARLGHPNWGTFKLGKTSPLTATSGLTALVASFIANHGDWSALTLAEVRSRSLLAKVATSELATSHYMSTPQHFLFHAREAEQQGSVATFLSAMIMDEKTLWDYNRGVSGMSDMMGMPSSPPREKLVPIYPREGVFVADNPAAILSAGWVSTADRAAAADFVRYARTVEGQTVVRHSGYRDLNGHTSTALSRVGFAAPTVHAIQMPDAAVLAAVQRSFPLVRKRARVLFLVDVSGSMSDHITRTVTKLSAAKRAIADALRYFRDTDEVGLAAFSNRPHGRLTPGVLTPVAPLGSNRPAFLAGLRALRPVSETPLYNAVDQFSTAMLKSYQATKINAVVLLSDGHNETDQAETRAQLLARLAVVHKLAPILVFTLAYGHDADTDTLNAIAEATGAHYYDATNPSTVNRVLAQDLVTSF